MCPFVDYMQEHWTDDAEEATNDALSELCGDINTCQCCLLESRGFPRCMVSSFARIATKAFAQSNTSSANRPSL